MKKTSILILAIALCALASAQSNGITVSHGKAVRVHPADTLTPNQVTAMWRQTTNRLAQQRKQLPKSITDSSNYAAILTKMGVPIPKK